MDEQGLVDQRFEHARAQRVAREFAVEKPRGQRLVGELTATELGGVITGAVFKAAVGVWALIAIIGFGYAILVRL